MHVVGLRRVVGDQLVELGVLAPGGVGRRLPGRALGVRRRQEREQVAAVLDQRPLVGRGEMRHTGAGRVGGRPAELLEAHLLARHGLHDLGAGDEHVRRLLDHHHEVGDGGRVDRAARARAHDERDLRDHAGGLHVSQEDVGVAGERDDALLDAGPARVVDSDDRAAEPGGHVHDLHDLLGKGLAQGAAEYGEVLREHEHPPALDRAVPGDDAVAVRPVLHHSEVRVAVLDERIQLGERAGIEQELHAFARQELAALALPLDRRGRSGVRRLLAQPLDRLDPITGGSGRHRGGSLPKSSAHGRMPPGNDVGPKGVQMQRIGENPS